MARVNGAGGGLGRAMVGEGITVNVRVPGRISTQRLGQLDAACAWMVA
ncbi:hypothetical protein [Rahnella bruchi]|nr:hypothetical protein [Rahnella bruchi]